MRNDPVLLVLLSIGVAWHVEMAWLASMLAGVGFLMVMSSLMQRPAEKAPAPGQPQEVLSPVIVQDTGTPPYLYPPDFRIKINPQWSANNMWEWASYGLGSAFGTAKRALGGSPGWTGPDMSRARKL